MNNYRGRPVDSTRPPRISGSYHTIIFAPDTLQNDGPLMEMPNSGFHGLGTQSTLPIPDPEPVLYDHRDRAIYFENPAPKRRRIGFGR